MLSESSNIVDDIIGKEEEHSTMNTDWRNYAFLVTLAWFLLFRFKNPLQYHVKFVTYFIVTMAYCVSIIPFSLLRPYNCRNINWVSKTISFLYKIFGYEYILENGKYLQINQPYVLIANHQSALDFMTMMNIWPCGNCTPLAKKELFWFGPFGLATWLCGITFIDRLNHEKAKGTIVKLSERINRDNLRVFIFPEGTRSPNKILPFKKGAFHLAIEAQVPIVCVVISSYLNFLNADEKKFTHGGTIKARVLPPFQTKGMTAESVGHLTKHLQEAMQHEFDLLNREINLDEKYLNKSVSECTEDLLNLSTDDVNNTMNSDLEESSFIDREFNVNLNRSVNSTMEKQVQSDDNNNSINDDENKKIS